MSDDVDCELPQIDGGGPSDGVAELLGEHHSIDGGYTAVQEEIDEGKENMLPRQLAIAESALNESTRVIISSPTNEKRVPLKQLSPDPAASNGFVLQQTNGKRARLDLPKQPSRPQSPRTGSPLRQVTMPRVVQSPLLPNNDR